jgi:hypothetical protein
MPTPSYSPHNFVDGSAGGTPITAAVLNESEAAIAALRAAAVPQHLNGLQAALVDGSRSCAFQVLGDSTGMTATRWPRLLANSLAASYPAWTVTVVNWNDVTEEFDPPVVVQTGPSGRRVLDGTTGTTSRVLDAASSPYLSGVIDVRLRVAFSDFPSSTTRSFAGKSGADPVRGWFVGMSGTAPGRMTFTWTTDGTAASQIGKTATAQPVITNGTPTWLRWVFKPDNGAGGCDFLSYQSTDEGVTWTQIGATVTTAGVVTITNNATRGYEIGGTGNNSNPVGKIYEVQFRDGLAGPIMTPVLPDLWPPYNTNAAGFTGSPTLTVVNGSKSGASIGTYLGDSVRLPRMTPSYGQLATFLSTSHNEGSTIGPRFAAVYDAWRVAVEARLPGVPTVLLTQNPETSGSTWYREHARRRLDLLAYATSKGLGVIDTYKAFLDAGWPSNLMFDAVHPSDATGSPLWSSTVKSRIDLS